MLKAEPVSLRKSSPPSTETPADSGGKDNAPTDKRGLALVFLGAAALAATAFGAIAIGSMAIGSLGVGRARIGRLRIRRLEVDELVVRSSKGQDEPPA